MRPLLEKDLDHILAHTEAMWSLVKGERFFITGGTGFFGCWLLESLSYASTKLGLKLRAVVLTRSVERFAKKAPHLVSQSCLEFVKGDIRNFRLPSGDFSFIIHAATDASAHLNKEKPLLMFDTIVNGTKRVLEFAAERNVKRILFTSSGAVYGKQPTRMKRIPEDYNGAPNPFDPSAAYGSGKRAAEFLCSVFARENASEVLIARCFAFLGPHLPLDKHFAIGNFIRDKVAGKPITVRGDGTPRRSYLYAADLAIWLWTILFKGINCHPYNVGSDQDLSIDQLAKIVAKCGRPNVDVRIIKTAAPQKGVERYVPATDRAKKELGLREWISLEDGIKRTLEWLKTS